MPIAIKRAYEAASAEDGYRFLVDGLWPRGITKAQLKIDAWMRQIAPSGSLRKWYGHKPEKWGGFSKKYRQELSKAPRKALLDELVERARKEQVTLVFGARDAERSNAAVLAEIIRRQLRVSDRKPLVEAILVQRLPKIE
jgi:uncharacterized protein YeaO (DUF488 family)